MTALGLEHSILQQIMGLKAERRNGCAGRKCGAMFAEVMGVMVEVQYIYDARLRAEVAAVVEHVLSDRPGEWRASLIGTLAHDEWELKVEGPNGFERSYVLEGAAGEHRPEVIRVLLERMLAPALKTSSTSSV